MDKRLQEWIFVIKEGFFNPWRDAGRILWFCLVIVFALFMLCIAILISLKITITSTYRSIYWCIRTKKSRRAYYRKWLREVLRKELEKFRGDHPVVLHLDGPNGFNWQHSKYLQPGEEPPEWFPGLRPVKIGSTDWLGYVRYVMRSKRPEFARDNIVLFGEIPILLSRLLGFD